MSDTEQLVRQVTEAILQHLAGVPKGSGSPEVPIGVSNRHVHLSRQDVDLLFGPGYEITRMKELQPGQFAAKETVILAGPKGTIEKVRILGPVRRKTQVEISRADGYVLGIKAPVRDSGDHEGTPGLVLVGPKGAVTLENGVIVARRHIHMGPRDAEMFGVSDGDQVDVEVMGLRGVVFRNVLIRVHKDYELEMHIDLEEGNAADLNNRDFVRIIGMSRGMEDHV